MHVILVYGVYVEHETGGLGGGRCFGAAPIVVRRRTLSQPAEQVTKRSAGRSGSLRGR